ncbi:MAG TPA: sulfotransferase family 2 domain-containing protein [Candidatus Acidoferrales bacterium]|nr:sulfotransferase family 2 domain-containing protein [Candidatus Acidoferrales bacterium]
MFYFLHITKCAGTSFIALARKNVSLFRPCANGNPLNPLTSNRLQFWTWQPDEQRHFLSSGLCELIANENQLGLHHQFYEGVIHITILRDPLDRLFSEYQFRSRGPENDVPLEMRGRRFAAFLENERGVSWRRNTLVTALSYRGGDSTERLDLAKQRLLQFDHVFLTDTLSEDMKVLGKYGWDHLQVPWKNTPAGTEKAAGWSVAREALRDHPKLLEQLSAEHSLDLELFAFAKAHFARRAANVEQPQRAPLPSTREMPESDNFEFLLYCAYEAHLKGDESGCMTFLSRAGRFPEADEIFEGRGKAFVKRALQRFSAPKRVEKERRQKRRRGRWTAAEASA